MARERTARESYRRFRRAIHKAPLRASLARGVAPISLRHPLGSFLLQSQLRCPCAPLHDLEITLNRIGADFVWVRTFAAAREHSVLVECIVELRMVREQHRRTG